MKAKLIEEIDKLSIEIYHLNKKIVSLKACKQSLQDDYKNKFKEEYNTSKYKLENSNWGNKLLRRILI